MKNRTKKTTQITMFFILVIVAVVGYYVYLVNRDKAVADNDTLTAVEEVLVRDLTNNYPPSPKEVVKYYNQIMKCFYNEECSNEEIEQLGKKALELYDEELIEHNPWDNYFYSLLGEIQSFKNAKKKIAKMEVSSSVDVDYFEQDGYSFAKLRSGYAVLEGSTSTTSVQVYLLRKDANGHWKIYGWDLAENVDGNIEDMDDDSTN